MAYLQHLVGCSFVLLLCVQFSYPIRCFKCKSHEDGRCAQEIIPKELEVDCSSEDGPKYTLCRKIKQIVDIEVNGMTPQTRIIRSCGWVNSTGSDCYLRTGFGLRQEVCACYKDSCNGSTSLFVSTSLVLVLLSLLKLTL